MADGLIPTEDEIKAWLLSTLQHACNIEYFFEKLGIGNNDPERPHDLIGVGNKYEWNTIKGFALQYRIPKVDFKTYILPALELHRQQYHHRKWNNPDPNDKTKPIHGASEEDMLVGAADAVCALLENRIYQGGTHDYEGVIEIAKNNPPHKMPWLLKVIPEMRRLKQPSLGQITALNGFPNIGLKEIVYEAIAKRTYEAVEMLRNEHGYLLNI